MRLKRFESSDIIAHHQRGFFPEICLYFMHMQELEKIISETFADRTRLKDADSVAAIT